MSVEVTKYKHIITFPSLQNDIDSDSNYSILVNDRYADVILRLHTSDVHSGIDLIA